MTLYVERNVLQSVDPLNLPYEEGRGGLAYERFVGAARVTPTVLPPVWWDKR